MQSREEIRASTQTHVNFRLLHVAIHTRALYNKECNHMSISTTPSQLMINHTHSQSQSLKYTVRCQISTTLSQLMINHTHSQSQSFKVHSSMGQPTPEGTHMVDQWGEETRRLLHLLRYCAPSIVY